MKTVRKRIAQIDRLMNQNMSDSAHHLVIMGAMMFVGFPVLYWIWSKWDPEFYEPTVLLIIASLLGLGLILTPFWPARCKRYLAWYWFLTLLYTLPFLFIYSFLINKASDVSSMSLLASIFLLVLLVDVLSLGILLLLGSGFAFLMYYWIVPDFYLGSEHIEVGIILLFVVIAGSSVTYKTAVMQRQRLVGMAAAAGMVAHELRTPLLGIKSGAQALCSHLPQLFEGYRLATAQSLISEPLRASRQTQLAEISERMIREIDYANTMIDMLLIKAGQEQALQNSEMVLCSMAECLQEAMARYPFRTEKMRSLVHWEGDFQFMGSKLLMQHVLFNLLKNALYFISMTQKGEIQIWTEQAEKFHYLRFRDTAKGMSQQEVLKLFDHFYTTTFMGTGIGLSFCKLVMARFGGEMTCQAEEGAYTLFTLSFPIVTRPRI